jgi:hypothetical protein
MGMGFTPFDPNHNRICGNLEPWISRGMLDGNKRFSIVDFDQYCLATGAMELALVCHNMTLALQAMGLGGWLFTGINPPSLMGAFEADGIKRLAFRFSRDRRLAAPNPVGIDGHFEALCPPYCADMRAAAMKFNNLKFGPGGTFDPARPGPFRDNASVKARVERYTAEFVEMLGRPRSTCTTPTAALLQRCRPFTCAPTRRHIIWAPAFTTSSTAPPSTWTHIGRTWRSGTRASTRSGRLAGAGAKTLSETCGVTN